MLYKKLGRGLLVPLNEEYNVRANIIHVNNEKDTYYVTYEICDTDIGKYDGVGFEDGFTLVGQNINIAVVNHVAALYKDGYFDFAINRYERETQATNIGLSFLEEIERCL